MTAPKLELRTACKRFGSNVIVHRLNLSVAVGETLCLIGESGCGKSVSMKLAAALLPPTSGGVLWDGDPVHALPPEEFRRRRMKFGYLFQGAALFDSMTVFENVAFGPRQLHAAEGRMLEELVAARIREVGLPEHVTHRKPAGLSGGQRKRVGLARALALDPDVMLYDEPTTGLDPVMSDVINELILRVAASRDGDARPDRPPVTSIVVTHDMHTVRRVADRVVMLRPAPALGPLDSQVLFDGTVEDLFASDDPAVGPFVRGEAGAKLAELAA
ncbi:ABC transporter ATP-binding protein [Alienimonas californiensis]|uniref:Methionine import ATP-binding protein MetN 2 n=1 Tax=Alienimonas californiensis TaxID=2527989 RepID=A0A517PDC7_9PLAN|nr:ATP-binding cassette domain-containing protein [Alienimonas californiensis]QDT17331.1 Methionine import ATP-binding protein MetN 2 [Alienimonas californiensis]